MEQFEHIILEKDLISEFIKFIIENSMSDSDTNPPTGMKMVTGVVEKNTGIILTQNFESKKWRGKEGDHDVEFVGKCGEDFFVAKFESNAYGDYAQYAKIYLLNNKILSLKHQAIIRNAIDYFWHSEDYFEFADKYEKEHGEPIYKLLFRREAEIKEEWMAKINEYSN